VSEGRVFPDIGAVCACEGCECEPEGVEGCLEGSELGLGYGCGEGGVGGGGRGVSGEGGDPGTFLHGVRAEEGILLHRVRNVLMKIKLL